MKTKSIWQHPEQTIESVTKDIKDLEAEGYKRIEGCWRCYPDYVCKCPEDTELEKLKSTRFLTMTYGFPRKS